MAIYERYPVLTSARQQLFSPSCPVYVHQYQISYDRESLKRLLQVRMVNMSDRELHAVYLRVVCKDEREQMLLVMHTVPVTGLCVARGAVFGDERIISLWSAQTVCVDVIVERAVFGDGSVWNEPEPSDVCRIPEPSPVKQTDPLYALLAKTGAEAGVSNAFYYRTLREGWLCTCGLPNSNWRTSCGHCGTNREWLSEHMDATRLKPAVTERAPESPKQPTATREEPAGKPAVMPEPVAAAVQAVPSYIAHAPVYSPEPLYETEPPYEAEPQQPTYLEREEFPPLTDRREERPRRSAAGKIVATVLVILIMLGVGGFFAYRYLMPNIRFRQADNLAAEGKYDEAIAMYEQLADYGESESRIMGCRYNQALLLMGEQKYEEAHTAFAALEGYKNSNGYAADCVYGQGVLAFNGGDVDTAWECVQQLQEVYPDYQNTKQLSDSCCYSFGMNEYAAGEYEKAAEWFNQATDYSDSTERVLQCRYELALQMIEEGNYIGGEEAFSDLGDYADSAQQRYAAMYAYCKENLTAKDQTTVSFLTELAEAEYSDSQQLLDGLYAWELEVFANTDISDTATKLTTVDKLSNLVLHYTVTGEVEEQKLSILMVYTLPDGKSGNKILNESGTVLSSGTFEWKSLQLPANTAAGTLTLKICNAQDGEELQVITLTVNAADEA